MIVFLNGERVFLYDRGEIEFRYNRNSLPANVYYTCMQYFVDYKFHRCGYQYRMYKIL